MSSVTFWDVLNKKKFSLSCTQYLIRRSIMRFFIPLLRIIMYLLRNWIFKSYRLLHYFNIIQSSIEHVIQEKKSHCEIEEIEVERDWLNCVELIRWWKSFSLTTSLLFFKTKRVYLKISFFSNFKLMFVSIEFSDINDNSTILNCCRWKTFLLIQLFVRCVCNVAETCTH